jgi:hypothetical protein
MACVRVCRRTSALTWNSRFQSGTTPAVTPVIQEPPKAGKHIAQELSDLVVYCQSVSFKGFGKAKSMLNAFMTPSGG